MTEIFGVPIAYIIPVVFFLVVVGMIFLAGWPDLSTPHKCEKCMYWEFWREIAPGCTMGICRRYPPLCVDEGGENFTPVTGSEGWCGEWERGGR